MLQYGRLNIELVRQQGKKRERDESEDDGGGGGGGLISMFDHHNISDSSDSSKCNKNGNLGSNVIARTKDLILVPQPDIQQQKNDCSDLNIQNDLTDDDNQVEKVIINFITIGFSFFIGFCH